MQAEDITRLEATIKALEAKEKETLKTSKKLDSEISRLSHSGHLVP